MTKELTDRADLAIKAIEESERARLASAGFDKAIWDLSLQGMAVSAADFFGVADYGRIHSMTFNRNPKLEQKIVELTNRVEDSAQHKVIYGASTAGLQRLITEGGWREADEHRRQSAQLETILGPVRSRAGYRRLGADALPTAALLASLLGTAGIKAIGTKASREMARRPLKVQNPGGLRLHAKRFREGTVESIRRLPPKEARRYSRVIEAWDPKRGEVVVGKRISGRTPHISDPHLGQIADDLGGLGAPIRDTGWCVGDCAEWDAAQKLASHGSSVFDIEFGKKSIRPRNLHAKAYCPGCEHLVGELSAGK